MKLRVTTVMALKICKNNGIDTCATHILTFYNRKAILTLIYKNYY